MYFLALFCRRIIDDVNSMEGWFKKIWKSVSSSTQHQKDTKETQNSHNSGALRSTSPQCPLPQSSETASSTQQPEVPLDSEVRWKRKYDVFVCHSTAQSDVEEATRLVSFLEASPCGLRCFLRQRDTCPGGAVATELLEALQDSHLRALLITPNFVKDDWCSYMMHHALAQGPMSNRMVPLIQNLHPSQYPPELKFYYYIDLSKNPHQGYTLINNTVLKYLDDLVKKKTYMMLDSSMSLSGGGLEAEDKLVATQCHAGTSIPLEVMPQ